MIIRQIAVACLIYVALVLQSSLAHDLTVASFQPWLPGIALTACVLLFDGATSLAWAGILGFGVDCISADRLGVHLAIATLVAGALMVARSDNHKPGLVLIAAFVFSGTILWKSASAIVHGILARQKFDLAPLAESASKDACYSMAITIFVLMAGRLLLNSITPSRTSQTSISNQWSMLTGE